ncbi:unnamed protein product [Zymoseptoria tritici ST99CH_1A5]|uniref:Uncharacterized protein n=1 Tax=Zymoseptoria tritici ST99CH_1A5 TaxID=1276529 RepID=A0A1Y6LZE1_ZYMTR|nr:unnamed protein product [Zymoseptoria tritici ST99CH_1A5]
MEELFPPGEITGIEDSLAPTVKRPRGYNTPQFLSNLFGILRKPGEESYPKQIISEQLHITMKPSQIQALFSAIMLFSLPALAAKKNCGGCPICQGDVCHYTDPNGQPACKQLSTTPFRVKVTPGDRCYDRGFFWECHCNEPDADIHCNASC